MIQNGLKNNKNKIIIKIEQEISYSGKKIQ